MLRSIFCSKRACCPWPKNKTLPPTPHYCDVAANVALCTMHYATNTTKCNTMCTLLWAITEISLLQLSWDSCVLIQMSALFISRVVTICCFNGKLVKKRNEYLVVSGAHQHIFNSPETTHSVQNLALIAKRLHFIFLYKLDALWSAETSTCKIEIDFVGTCKQTYWTTWKLV